MAPVRLARLGERRVEKLCGSDQELANFVLGLESTRDTCYEASRALLQQVEGVHSGSASAQEGTDTATVWNAQDWGRRYLPSNGGCIYIDLDHLELCIPEVRSARDCVAAQRAMLRIARKAQVRADAALPAGQRLQVLANNTDGRSHSYGSHLNLLVSRAAWSDLFERRFHYLQFLASFQVSSIVLSGQGKVGSENGRPEVDYQISQRADFFETLAAEWTTYRRPLVNSRNEALCGSPIGGASRDLARLHSIFYDSTLCDAASWLKVGTLQIALALVEAEQVDPALVLEDPVDAVVRFSHDPGLRTPARTVGGRWLTAVELQALFLEEARRAAAAGALDTVPEAREILDLWEDTLARLERRDWEALAGRLDWVLKRRLLEQALVGRPGLDWRSTELRHLDQVYSSLDPHQGLFWACAEAGAVERFVPEAAIERLVHEPPEDTRAWTRAQVLRAFAPAEIEHVDWDRIRLRVRGGSGAREALTLELDDPRGFTRRECEGSFAAGSGASPSRPRAGEREVSVAAGHETRASGKEERS